MAVTLNIRPALMAARKVFDAGQLQAQDPEASYDCLYSGPCAIGVGLTPAARSRFDDQLDFLPGGAAVRNLIRYDFLKTDDIDALEELQTAHDEVLTSGSFDMGDFEAVLIELEERFP